MPTYVLKFSVPLTYTHKHWFYLTFSLHFIINLAKILTQSPLFLLLSLTPDRNLIHFVFFIEIYQIWPENFEEIIIISSIKTVIPPDKQHEWVKRAKILKNSAQAISINLKIVQNVIFSKNTTLQSVFL